MLDILGNTSIPTGNIFGLNIWAGDVTSMVTSLRPPCKNALALSDAIIHLPKRTQVQGVARFYEHYIGSAITKKYAVYEAGDWWFSIRLF
jgi:hypothetical protein